MLADDLKRITRMAGQTTGEPLFRHLCLLMNEQAVEHFEESLTNSDLDECSMEHLKLVMMGGADI